MQLPPLDERNGPARQLSAHEQAAFVARAVAAAFPNRASRHRGSRVWRSVAVLAGSLAMAGVATAGVIAYRRVEQRRRDTALVDVTSTSKHRPAVRAIAAAQPPSVNEAEAFLPHAEPVPVHETHKATSTSPVPLTELLQAAARLRASRRWSEAAAAYQRLLRANPHSDLGRSAGVALAYLKLEHLGDPAGAKRLFESIVVSSPGGPLGEEGRWGLSQALQALGDRGGEQQALKDFVDQHPDSIRRRRAEARLLDLTTP